LLRPLVRRPTGGGIVPHDADWTYSLVLPANHSWHGFKAVESYRQVHQWIQSAFAELNLETELASQARKAEAGQCFAGHEKFDLLWRGKKIAGAAQRRTRAGLLIQGSVQSPLPIERSAWEKAMCDVDQNATWRDLEMDRGLQKRAETLTREKYGQSWYNQKR
jgi:lipoate-protein ligase A